METTKTRNRDRRNGKYTYAGQWDRKCECGLTLGVHEAEAPHGINDGTIGPSCPGFRPAKVTR